MNSTSFILLLLIYLFFLLSIEDKPNSPRIMESVYSTDYITDAEWKILNKYALSGDGHIDDYKHLLHSLNMRRYYEYKNEYNHKQFRYQGLPFCDGYNLVLKSERVLADDTKNTISKQYERKYKMSMGDVCVGQVNE